MTVPTLITDLSATAGSNPPSGAESVINGDDHLRAHGAFIRQLYDSILSLLVNLTTTGNTILGDATSDTLNVGAGGLVKDASGNVGVGIGAGINIAGKFNVRQDSGDGPLLVITNRVINGSVHKYGALIFSPYRDVAEPAFGAGVWAEGASAAGYTADLVFGTSVNGAANAFPTERMRIDSDGNLIPILNTSAPTLATNYQMAYALTSNTNLRISVRGSDGVTRVTNLTLA